MHIAFSRTDHRPWPLRKEGWTWRQRWGDLLFAHWPVSVDSIRPMVPESLSIQEYGGTAWVGVVPFSMSGIMRRPLPDLPWVSKFLELNVRLYVELDGKPGVWFLSLDASNPIAVWAARRFFHLPYFYSSMSLRVNGGDFEFASQRVKRSQSAPFDAIYRPVSDIFEASPGSLEHFLTERYCLYTQRSDGSVYRGDIHHVPWPLQQAEGDIKAKELLRSHGLSVEGQPLLHFSKGVDVVVWPLERCR